MADENNLHSSMLARDMGLGGAAGALGGGLLSHHLKFLHPGVAASLGGAAGVGLGGLVGSERVNKDKVRHQRHVEDVDRAQENRKEMFKMRQKKASTLDGIMLAAMADELQHIHQEKVAINLAPVGNMLANVGSRALTGLTSAATKIAPSVATKAPGLGAALGNAGGHMMQLGNAVGGGRRLSQLAGGAILGGGALAAGGALAGRATAPRGY